MSKLSKGSESLAALKDVVRSAISNKYQGLALKEIFDYCNDIIGDYSTVASVMASDELDSLCEEVGKSLQSSDVSQVGAQTESKGTIILVTELVSAGGHMEVLKDYVRIGQFAKPITVLLTDVLDRFDASLVSDFMESHKVEVVCAKGETLGEKLVDIIEVFRRLNPCSLVTLLYNHDSLGVAAAASGLVPKVYYVHVGDHQISLGAALERFIHVDLTETVCELCSKRFRGKNKYWPLTITAPVPAMRQREFMRSGSLRTCSSGRYAKFSAFPYKFDYHEVVKNILLATGGSHIHFGYIPVEELSILKEKLWEAGIDASRFTVVPWVESLALGMINRDIDLYLSSFPITGTKAVIEAMAAGIPLLIHKSYRSNLIDSVNLAYPRAFKWENYEDLSTTVGSISPEGLAEHSLLSRQQYDLCHGREHLEAAISESKETFACASSTPRLYDELQIYLDNLDIVNAGNRALQGRYEDLLGQYEVVHAEYLKVLAAYNRLVSKS